MMLKVVAPLGTLKFGTQFVGALEINCSMIACKIQSTSRCELMSAPRSITAIHIMSICSYVFPSSATPTTQAARCDGFEYQREPIPFHMSNVITKNDKYYGTAGVVSFRKSFFMSSLVEQTQALFPTANRHQSKVGQLCTNMEETTRRALGCRDAEDSSRSSWWTRVGRSLLGTPLSFISPRKHSDRRSLPQTSPPGKVVEPSTTADNEKDKQGSVDRSSVAVLARRQHDTPAVTSRGHVGAERRNSVDDGGGAARWRGGAVDRAALERQLHSELPLVWMFLREREGWGFVDQGSWDVCRPRRGNETDVVKPLPQSQVSSPS